MEVCGSALGLDVFDARRDGGMRACLGSFDDAGGHGVEIDVSTRGQQGFFVEDSDALEAFLEERAADFVLSVGHPCEWFLEAFHEPAQALQALAGRCDPLRILQSPLDPFVGDGHWQPVFTAWRKEASPASDDFFVGPVFRHVGVEPDEDVKVVVHDGEPADGNGKDFRKFLKPSFDPIFASTPAFGLTEQERALDAAVNAVIPARDRSIHQLRGAIVMGGSPLVLGGSLAEVGRRVNRSMRVQESQARCQAGPKIHRAILN